MKVTLRSAVAAFGAECKKKLLNLVARGGTAQFADGYAQAVTFGMLMARASNIQRGASILARGK
jgi:hypothetical protein